jgi:hypothetical protein
MPLTVVFTVFAGYGERIDDFIVVCVIDGDVDGQGVDVGIDVDGGGGGGAKQDFVVGYGT